MLHLFSVITALSIAGVASAQPLVHVIVDMDPFEPGIQDRVVIGPSDTGVRGVAVYIYAVRGEPQIRSLGYLGGIDRGLSFGHAPHNSNRGSVTTIVPHAGTPVIPGASVELLRSDQCCTQHWFAGPEVQYLEFSGNAPATIPAWPAPAVFTVDIELNAPRVGDEYNFYLLDAVAANWAPIGNRGMFTTRQGDFIDTGGDATPDMTPTVAGLDPDAPVPVPPGSFVVDLIDGPLPDPPHSRGGATIAVLCLADYNRNGSLDSQDFFDFITDFFVQAPRSDFNRDDTLNSQDFFDFLAAFFIGCV